MKLFNIEDYTKYEKTRILGARALQIAMGAPVLVARKQSEIDPIEIARKELDKGVVPLTVKRILPRTASADSN
ncbi:MAG: DNA-directed RNA polymerase subunit K [Candidatus Aenigmarchaeota archaeon]|nr:DNA-directed RNA polymerase subunit K [Candidatus Aenigmarchaeota archaeon]